MAHTKQKIFNYLIPLTCGQEPAINSLASIVCLTVDNFCQKARKALYFNSNNLENIKKNLTPGCGNQLGKFDDQPRYCDDVGTMVLR